MIINLAINFNICFNFGLLKLIFKGTLNKFENSQFNHQFELLLDLKQKD